MLHEQENWHTGFIIFKEDFAKSAQRLLILTLDRGLIHIMAYGNNSGRNTIGSKLEYFSLLSFKVGGKHGNTLRAVEVESIPLHLKGTNYYSACYLNELVMYLVKQEALAQQEALELFCLYKDTLLTLASDTTTNNTLINLALRKFELRLLHLVGIIYSLELDYQLQPIQPQLTYYFSSEQGFISHQEFAQHAQSVDPLLASEDPIYQQYLEYQIYQQQDLSLNSFLGSDLLQMQHLFMQDAANHYGLEFSTSNPVTNNSSTELTTFSSTQQIASQDYLNSVNPYSVTSRDSHKSHLSLPTSVSAISVTTQTASSNINVTDTLDTRSTPSFGTTPQPITGFGFGGNNPYQTTNFTPINNRQIQDTTLTSATQVVAQWQSSLSANSTVSNKITVSNSEGVNQTLFAASKPRKSRRTSNQLEAREFDEVIDELNTAHLIQGHAVLKLNGLSYTPDQQEMAEIRKLLSPNEFLVYQFECKRYLLQEQLHANQQVAQRSQLTNTPNSSELLAQVDQYLTQDIATANNLQSPNSDTTTQTEKLVAHWQLQFHQEASSHPAREIQDLLELYRTQSPNNSFEQADDKMTATSDLSIQCLIAYTQPMPEPQAEASSQDPDLSSESNTQSWQLKQQLDDSLVYNPQELAEQLLTSTLQLSTSEIAQLKQDKLEQLEKQELEPISPQEFSNAKLSIEIDTIPQEQAYRFVYEFTNLEEFRKLPNQIEFIKQVRRLTQVPVKDKVFHSRQSLQEYLRLTQQLQ